MASVFLSPSCWLPSSCILIIYGTLIDSPVNDGCAEAEVRNTPWYVSVVDLFLVEAVVCPLPTVSDEDWSNSEKITSVFLNPKWRQLPS